MSKQQWPVGPKPLPLEKQLENLQNYFKERRKTRTPEESRAALISAGILDEDGNLAAWFDDPNNFTMPSPLP